MQANDDLSLLIDAAKASGDIARKFFKAAPEVWDKSDNAGPVTEADLAIDTMLRTELRAARPEYGWLSEETEDTPERLEKEHVFIVDPIDGTRAFIAGETSFSHSLAIAKNGEVIAAVVYLPMKDLLFTASETATTELNGESIQTTSRQIDGASVLAAKPNMNAEHWKGSIPPLRRHFRPSLAYRLSLVASGRFDAMLTLRDCWEWDIAAGDLIVRQSGGMVTDRRSNALIFNSKEAKTLGCLAAGDPLHGQITARLRPE